MKNTLRHIPATLAVVAIACGMLAPSAKAGSHSADVIFEWNQIAQTYVGCAGCQPFEQVRSYAMVHIAMADAVVAIEGGFGPYHASISAPHGASAEAAAAQAARDVLLALFPTNQATFDAALASRLTTIPPGRRWKGIEVGKLAAAKVLSWRDGDGILVANPQPPPFLPSVLPGIWNRESGPPAQFANFGVVKPFGLLTSTQFLPVPPPQLESVEYANDFNDVKDNGSQSSATRTAEQTRFALLFAGAGSYANVTNPFRLWHNVARDIAMIDNLSLAETARLFALMTASIHDSLQSAHTSKFVYRLWRPVTAIAAADIDNNDDTAVDATTWVPLLFTPPYPSHASNMSCIGVGAAQMLANVLGTDDKSFVATWYTGGSPPTVVHNQPYNSLWALAQDEGSSRVWGGIHFRFEIDASEDACRRVADYIFDKFMQPLKG